MAERLFGLFGIRESSRNYIAITTGSGFHSSRTHCIFLEESRPFRQLLWALLFLSNTIRPDISRAKAYLARRLQTPAEAIRSATESLLRYLKWTRDYVLGCEKGGAIAILRHGDAEWGQEHSGRKLISELVLSSLKLLFPGKARSSQLLRWAMLRWSGFHWQLQSRRQSVYKPSSKPGVLMIPRLQFEFDKTVQGTLLYQMIALLTRGREILISGFKWSYTMWGVAPLDSFMSLNLKWLRISW